MNRPASKQPIVFTPGSKVIFVAGGYQGGQERVGVVLDLSLDGDVLLCMLDADEPGAPSYIESFNATQLAADIAKGRLPGSLKETRYVPSANPCPPLLPRG